MLMKYLFVVSMLHCATEQILGQKIDFHTTVIGALFDRDAFMRRAFSLAIRTTNECAYNREYCDKIAPCPADINCQLFHQLKISAFMLQVDNNLLNVYQKVGQLAGYQTKDAHFNTYGMAALVGPHDDLNAKFVQGMCEQYDLPHIVVKREMDHDRRREINLYPDIETLSTVYVKMIEKLNWTSFTVLYEKSENFLALDNVLKMHPTSFYKLPEIYAFKLGSGPNYSEPLLQAKGKKHTSIIIDCSYDHLSDILKQTQEVGLMTQDFRYIITSLDLQVIDLRPYQFSGVNISGIRIYDPQDEFVSGFVGRYLDELGIPSVDKLRTEEALMFDAISLFGYAYKDLYYEHKKEITGIKLPDNFNPVNNKWQLHPPESWEFGLSLRNYMLYNTINGLTGPVMLDSDGCRRRFKLDILNLHTAGLKKVGVWNPDDGFDDVNLKNELSVEHFNVLITLNAPYAMRVNFSKSMEGNQRYEGFVIDLIKVLSETLHFNYTFHVQEDSDNGKCNQSEKTRVCSCTGMMQKILTGEMQMAITDLTITEDRGKCVDFSTAFWNLGMSILFKKPVKAPATLFSFLSTFHPHVWIYLSAIYIFVSVLFFVLGRLSPHEWNNPFPCIEEPKELHNQFTISNAFWFTIGAIMQQGSEIAPISRSTRTLAGCWWFFCLIIVSTYTANLAAFLTIETPVKVVRGIEDLYNQTKIKFGAKKGGSTFMYFKSSKNPKHRQLAELMETKAFAKYMVPSNELGIRLAQKGDYAFIMESSSIEYIQYRYCDLEQAGPLIDQKSYAIGYKKNFKYAKSISREISKLQETLVIRGLYDKWWKERGAVCFDTKSNTADAMTLDQLNGVFLLLGLGIAVSALITAWEFCRGVQMVSVKEDVNFMNTLSSEVKLITKSKAIKPVLKRNKSMDSNLSDVYSCDYTMTTQI